MVVGILLIAGGGILAGLLLLIANGVYLFNKFQSYLADVTSISLFGMIKNLYLVLPVKNKMFVLGQLIILIIITIFTTAYFRKKVKKPTYTKSIFSTAFRDSESRTDLDMLYRLLVSKKELKLGDIEELFKINGDIALDWCKVLENAELAIIDYPNFQKPLLRLPEEEVEAGVKPLIKKRSINTASKKKTIKIINRTPVKTKTNNIKIITKKSAIKIIKKKKLSKKKKPISKNKKVVSKKIASNKRITRKK